MATALRDAPETAAQQARNRLAVGSLLGTLYVVASLVVVFYLLPMLWSLGVAGAVTAAVNGAVSTTLLILVMLGAAVGLVLFGSRLVGPKPVAGLRAGIVVGIVLLFLVSLLILWAGNILEGLTNRFGLFGTSGPLVGSILSAAIGVALLVWVARLYFRPKFDKWLVHLEELGWFSLSAYKRSQGQRVRRGTIVAILALAACGIGTMLIHRTLETGPQNWQLSIPFTGSMTAAGNVEYTTITILPEVRFSLPVLLTALALWVAFRLVNYPPFADFLIATEAELNKVSWTTRKRLVQDTIVVLTTILLVTAFLFTVDVLWVNFLESRWIQILQLPSGSVDSAEIDRQIEALNLEMDAAVKEEDKEKIGSLRAQIDGLRELKKRAKQQLDW